MKKLLLSLLLTTTCLAAHDFYDSNSFQPFVPDDEWADFFDWIKINVENLKHASASNLARDELLSIIEQGYRMDPYNMKVLIETLKHRNASDKAAQVILKSIEHDALITPFHLKALIETLAHADAASNATLILISAIEHGVEFKPRERIQLAEMTKIANARSYIEKIYQALNKRSS